MTLYFTRDQWGTRRKTPGGYSIGRVGEVIVHHSYKPHVPGTASNADERATVRGIQRFHMVEQDWDDVGYQFLVFQSGRAYEGRGWGRTGAHTQGRNSKSVGICFVINGDEHEPSERAWAKAREIIADGIAKGALDRDYVLSGHTDYAPWKSCPGDETYPIIGEHLSASLVQGAGNDISQAPEPEDDMPAPKDWDADDWAAFDRQLANRIVRYTDYNVDWHLRRLAERTLAAERAATGALTAAIAELRKGYGLDPSPKWDATHARRIADGEYGVGELRRRLEEAAS